MVTNAKQERRLKADALLAMGETPKSVGEQLGIPEVTVRSWKKKLETTNEDLDTVVQVDATTLHQVAENIKATAPPTVIKKIDKLVAGVTGLQELEPKFHSLTLTLLEKAEELTKIVDEDGKSALSVKDWLALSNGIGNLYANIFNKSGVNVNVLNQTQVSGEKLSMFKSTMRNS